MATIAMMVGGAIVNALGFSGSNYLFSTLREWNAKEVEDERKWHNKVLEQLEAAQSQWTSNRILRLDFINEELRKLGHSIQTSKDVESAMHEYFLVYGKKLDPMQKTNNKSVLYTVTGTKKQRDSIHNVWVISHRYL